MQRILGHVINPTEDNAVIAGTTIINTIYDNCDYRISYISMGKGTFVSPERFRSPTLVHVLKGQLRIVILNQKQRRESVVNEGCGYFRPAKEYAGYYADDSDVILCEIILRMDSEVAMRLIPHTSQELIHLVHYEPGQVSRSHLVNDEFFQMNMVAFNESENKEFQAVDRPVFVKCMEGKFVISQEEKKFELQPGEAFVLPPSFNCTFSATSRTKILILYLTNKKKTF